MSLDVAILEQVNSFSSPILDTFFVAITQLGSTLAVTAIAAGLTAILWVRHYRRYAALIAISVGGATLLNLLLKAIFERTRPELWERLVIEPSYSFPSGHAMASSALAFSLIVIFWSTKWRWLVVAGSLAYVLVIGFSRLYLGVHYPTDVVAGWLVSAAWVALVALLIGRKKRR